MKNILFVCLGNSCRSQMAEGFARHYGVGVVNAASAGLAATTLIAPETRVAMREKNIELHEQFPKDFEPSVAASYDVVVNMSGFILPEFPSGPYLLDWDVEDPYGEPLVFHRKVRDQVEERVRKLVLDIAAYGRPSEEELVGPRIAPEDVRRPRLWQRFTKWR